MNKQESLEEVKDLAYYKTNAEEDYSKVPISVLRYISELEQEVERMYSEEELHYIMAETWIRCVGNLGENFKETRDIIIDKFKKNKLPLL